MSPFLAVSLNVRKFYFTDREDSSATNPGQVKLGAMVKKGKTSHFPNLQYYWNLTIRIF